jgi:hypothetical protein
VLKTAGALVAIVMFLIAGNWGYTVWQDHRFPRSEAGRPIPGGDWRVPSLVGNGHNVLLLMIDGLSVSAYESALAEGLMPNLARLLTTRPTASLVALATFPSATSPSVQELLSGRYADMDYLSEPGAVHGFDRDERQIIRYVTQPDAWQWPVPTLFDVVHDKPAITVFEGRWDGPTTILTQYNMAGQAILSAVGASALSAGDTGPVEAYLDMVRSKEAPVVSLVVLNEFDVTAHFYGPASPEAKRALRDCDTRLGRIVETMSGLPAGNGKTLLDETTILLFGDHGMQSSGHFINLPLELKAVGIKAIDVSTFSHIVLRERLGTIWTQWPDAILVAGGSNVTQIYLRKPGGAWSDEGNATPGEARHQADAPGMDALTRHIRMLDGIDQVVFRKPDGAIEILDRGSGARILTVREGEQVRYAYQIRNDVDADPLGYLGDPRTARLICREEPAIDACFHPAAVWFDETIDSRYPGAVPLIPKAFRPARFAGDIMVTARPGFSFLHNQKGDHGNLHRDSILTPLVLNGPGIRACKESHTPRLVDIFPSASVLLGARRDDPALRGLDGRVLDCIMEPTSGGGV